MDIDKTLEALKKFRKSYEDTLNRRGKQEKIERERHSKILETPLTPVEKVKILHLLEEFTVAIDILNDSRIDTMPMLYYGEVDIKSTLSDMFHILWAEYERMPRGEEEIKHKIENLREAVTQKIKKYQYHPDVYKTY